MSEPVWKQNAQAKAVLRDTVFANPELSLRAKAVFYVLIEHIDLVTLQCNPGRTRLAGKLGTGIRTIIRGLAELMGAGEVSRKLTKRSPIYTFPNLRGANPVTPNSHQGVTHLAPRGDTSGNSSGANPVTRTLEPIEPIKRPSGKNGTGSPANPHPPDPSPISDEERAANLAKLKPFLKAKRA